MNKLDEVFNFISSPFQYISLKHEDDKMVVFEKGDLLFVFNFHMYKSYENYKIGTQWGSEHKIKSSIFNIFICNYFSNSICTIITILSHNSFSFKELIDFSLTIFI